MLLNKVALVELCGTMQEDADDETLVADYAKSIAAVSVLRKFRMISVTSLHSSCGAIHVRTS